MSSWFVALYETKHVKFNVFDAIIESSIVLLFTIQLKNTLTDWGQERYCSVPRGPGQRLSNGSSSEYNSLFIADPQKCLEESNEGVVPEFEQRP